MTRVTKRNRSPRGVASNASGKRHGEPVGIEYRTPRQVREHHRVPSSRPIPPSSLLAVS